MYGEPPAELLSERGERGLQNDESFDVLENVGEWGKYWGE